MLPIFVNVAGRLVIVVGGGAVGRRKAQAAAEAGAVVRIVDPCSLPHEEPPRPITIEWLAEAYRSEHLEGAFLAFAAATPEVNAQVVADARARGIPVNAASAPAQGDFVLPSVLRQGGLTIAASTGGAAPAPARRLREKWQAEFDGAFAEWVQLLNEIRPEVLTRITDPAQRRALFDSFADWPWLEKIRNHGLDAVRAEMWGALPG